RRLQPLGRRLEAQVEQVLDLVLQGQGELLVAHAAKLVGFHDANPSYTLGRRPTKRQRNGILYATRARASRACASGNPLISNRSRPGWTTAAQSSGSPLPWPMRVSAGMAVTDLCGKTRMYSRPSPRTEWVAVIRPASIASALSQPPSRDCKPYSP